MSAIKLASSTTLEPLSLPGAGDWCAWLDEQGAGQLQRARRLLDELKANPPASALEVLEQSNRIGIAISHAAAAGGLLSEVHPDEAVRDRADEISQEVAQLGTDMGLDRELYAVFSGLDPAGLDEQAARVLQQTLRDFRRSGVDKDEATRERLRELNERGVLLSQEFNRNIRDDVPSIRVVAERLAGMPEDYLAAHPADDEGMVTITIDGPDYGPVMAFCGDRDLRADLTFARQNAAWPANDSVLQEILAVRRETASLLGYDSWADLDTEIKMIGNGAAIGELIDKVSGLVKDRAAADKAMLLARMRQDHPDAQDIQVSDVRYYTELVHREQYGVDGQVVRSYFPFEQVRQGLLDVTGRLFGLTWTPVDKGGTWHEDVTTYDVELDGVRIGRIHLDLHPREGKYKHAAQFTLVDGVAGQDLPEGVLVCNFNRGLMEHREVVTLFHEFGHLIHHVLGGQGKWIEFAGVATEWDFVEAPSQMLEEWAWDAEILATFARNADGATIPADLVAAMLRSEDFGKGAHTSQQMAYAAVSYFFHADQHDDLTELSNELHRRYSVFAPTPGGHMHCSFGHLDGYSSGYYTYTWSLVIAKDLFSAFDRSDMFAPEVARAYRDKILAPGGSKDAAQLVEDFLGRPYSFDAFAEWLTK